MADPGYYDPPAALIEQATAASGIALALGEEPRALGEEPRALVLLELRLRRNHGHGPADRITTELATDPDLAQELGRHLIAAAKAARSDLERFRAGGTVHDDGGGP